MVAESPANASCFKSPEIDFWRARSLGFTTDSDVSNRGEGQEISLKRDTDGIVLHNGGLRDTTLTLLEPTTRLYRFCSSAKFKEYQAQALIGGWWIKGSIIASLAEYALQNREDLSAVAARFLIITSEYSDCKYLGQVQLIKPLLVFSGEGRPATSRISPPTKEDDVKAISPDRLRSERQEAKFTLHAAPINSKITQHFIPGSRETLGSAMRIVWVKPTQEVPISVMPT